MLVDSYIRIAIEHAATLFTISKDFAQVTRVSSLKLHFVAPESLQ